MLDVFVLFLLCCFAFESEEIISSSDFPSTQECDSLADEATLKDGIQAYYNPCVLLFLCADHLNG